MNKPSPLPPESPEPPEPPEPPDPADPPELPEFPEPPEPPEDDSEPPPPQPARIINTLNMTAKTQTNPFLFFIQLPPNGIKMKFDDSFHQFPLSISFIFQINMPSPVDAAYTLFAFVTKGNQIRLDAFPRLEFSCRFVGHAMG